ncbi:MAG TPA: AgmX/PglI C-terminal domain-containing protein [Gemmatimonadaceae bacterium]|nr:AgmX/PglI C-terminal domain-containing protein [Gemmatimonadaceae bacterium]
MRRNATTLTYLTLALAGSGCASGGPARSSMPMAAATLAPSVSATAQPASGGSLAVGTFVRGREPQLQFCYAETRAASPTLAGSATVAVTLAADGRVLKADIVRRSWSGGDSGHVVEQCMLSRVRAWKFPAGDPEDGDLQRAHSFAVIFTR